MRLCNTTDLPSPLLRRIARAVCPPGVAGFDVEVRNFGGRGAAGTAYHRGSGYHDRATPFVVVRVARTDARARCRQVARGGYIDHDYGSRVEAFLFVVAHELRHLWQARGPRGRPRAGMVWGSRGRFSEKDADAYALRMQRRFRRGELTV